MTFGSTQILAFLKMRKNNRSTDQRTTTAPSSNPQAIGTKSMTSTDMRNHAHTSPPQYASHSIDASTQQNRFVRVYPSSAPPRYANRPIGSSRFWERLSLDMTAPKISAEQEQPRRLVESMVMVAETSGMTGEDIGIRGRGLGEKKDNRQACVPQVKEVVSSVSNLIKSAVGVVRQRSRSPSPGSGNSISDEEPFSVLAKFKLAGAEKLNMPRPPPPATVCLQRSNAVRYRNRPRLQSRDQQDDMDMLCYHPGGEADAYFLQDVGYGYRGRGRHSHSVPPNFANTKSQQWNGANGKGTTYSHVECYELPQVGCPQYRSYADMVEDGSRPRLRVMNRTTTDSSPQSLSSSEGSFANEDINFRAQLAASASLCYRTDIDIPDDASFSSSSSWPDYPEYHVDRTDHVSDGISEAFRAARRFFSDEWSVEDAVPAESRFSLCSSSDSVPEAVPASRRFSTGEFSVEEADSAESRFPSSSVSNGNSGDLGIERWWATNTRHVDDNSSADADDEGDEENNSSFPYYVRQGPLRVRNAAVSLSSEGSVPASAPTDWYYTQDSAETSEGNLADDDMAFYEGLYEEPDPDNHSGSIDQSQFAEFDGDFTDAPSLTNGTSPENSSRGESGSGRVLRVVNQTSPQDGAGSEDDDCPSESDTDDEVPQRGRSRTRRDQ
ncbi:uncharacterized protein J4E87_009362 [Alternaria ethzedia]|uniref:uncharacterized protein n=1 Tax=Alternaria ethzedia TaxID=181014 RepID=UPI0020C3FCDA|nr:uncharacterized protein J4E87_009362 [Alternaria ethzedia]KAI4614767.1 hypothetical protein J4E87_009362 [Alternaria ethzedia]